MANKLKVAVLMGGPSVEHEVSLKTGRNVLMNLDKRKYNALPVTISKDGTWEVEPADLKEKVDVAFIAMHGSYGEDGWVQYELDDVGLPYTGSDVHASALGMNKFFSLRLLRDMGFTVPPTLILHRVDWLRNQEAAAKLAKLFVESPWVVKPNRGGSSLDTIIVNDALDMEPTLAKLFQKYKDVIVQPYIKGKEYTCAVLDHGAEYSAYPLLPTEIVPKNSHFFDYNSKYKKDGAEEITPARAPDTWLRQMRATAAGVHHVLGLRGMSRTDFILGRAPGKKERKLYVLEVNTIPGLTKASLLPKAAEATGISFSELLDRIIRSALWGRYT